MWSRGAAARDTGLVFFVGVNLTRARSNPEVSAVELCVLRFFGYKQKESTPPGEDYVPAIRSEVILTGVEKAVGF